MKLKNYPSDSEAASTQLPRERRQHSRYPAHNLDVLIKAVDSEELPWELAELVSVDFNRFGIAVESLHSFNVGDHLSLVICTDDGMTSKVQAVICNRCLCQTGFRYGVFFDYENTKDSNEIQNRLATIEETMKP